MRRRAFLATCGVALAPAAGCASRSAPGDAATAAPATGGPPTTTPPGVSISFLSYQPALVTRTSPETFGVVRSNGVAHLFALVDAAGASGRPAPSAFTLHFDGEAIGPAPTRDVSAGDGNLDVAPYDGRVDAGWLLFSLPESGDAADARLTWPEGEWAPDDALRRRMAAEPPPLSLAFSAPESVEAGTAPTLSLTVRNEGEVPGRFLAALNRDPPGISEVLVTTVSKLVPAGGSTTWEYTDDGLDEGDVPPELVGDGVPDVTYRLSSYPRGGARRVRLVEG